MDKVLQIVNYYYPHIGGIEQVAHDISDAIKDKYEQKIICFNEDAEDGTLKCQRKETTVDTIDEIDVIRCGCITKKASQSISLTFGKELRKVMDSFKPDIVIFHSPNPFQASFLIPILKKTSVRFILYWHLDITKQKTLRKLFHGQTIKLLQAAEQIIATSPVYIDGSPYLSQYKEKCVVIPNSINENRMQITETIREKASEIREQNKDKFICFGIGRHIPYKGFKYLVEASKYLDDRFKIFIGGKGDLTEELKAMAAGDNKITFLGRVSDDDLIAYYLAMDIFCFPSITKNEAFGIALAEGMYFGKPAVTFHIPGSGVNYVNLKDITGLEVPNGDSKLYAEAMTKLAENPATRKQMGERARERVETLFMSSQFKNNILNLLSTDRGNKENNDKKE